VIQRNDLRLQRSMPGDLHAVIADRLGEPAARSRGLARGEGRERPAKLAFKCEQVGPDASVVVVTVPPPQRLD